MNSFRFICSSVDEKELFGSIHEVIEALVKAIEDPEILQQYGVSRGKEDVIVYLADVTVHVGLKEVGQPQPAVSSISINTADSRVVEMEWGD